MEEDAIAVSLLGGTGVGKTSLIRFLNGLPFDANLPPSHQIEQSLITLKRMNQNQRLRVWDICSEFMSMSCASLYYTHSEIILLCYAINDASSYDFAVNVWAEVKRNTVNDPNIVFLFVGMKKDMDDEREVPVSKARHFAEYNGMVFYEISLLSGVESVQLCNAMMTLLYQTRSVRIGYLLQACSIQLFFKRAKDKNRAESLQAQLRKNPYSTIYYKLTEKELEEEMDRLIGLYMELQEQKGEAGYRCMFSEPFGIVP
ncbi:hypothetical protein WA577_004019 [Blastocystis sp. JDR]